MIVMHSSKAYKLLRKILIRILICIIIAIVLFIVIIGPWPADNSHYSNKSYTKNTLEEIKKSHCLTSNNSQLFAGVDEIDITPPIGHKLAGYMGRKPMDSKGLHSNCFARALTLKSGKVKITILTVDVLLLSGNIRKKIIAKTGLSPDEIYFTATHSHSGPGSFVDDLLFEFVTGKYDSEYAEKFATQIADVIINSRKNLSPVAFESLQFNVPRKIANRIADSLPPYQKLSALAFYNISQNSLNSEINIKGQVPFAVLVSFSAHPTILTNHNKLISSEYPGAIVSELKRITGARHVLFAAGAVGDSAPISGRSIKQMETYGHDLANAVAKQLPKGKLYSKPDVKSLYLKIKLPSVRLNINSYLSFSPFVSYFIGDRYTYLSFLKIANMIMIGVPCDYSGALVTALEKKIGNNLEILVTSFNGDYKGYLVTNYEYSEFDEYETRGMNFFGPWGGDYINHIIGKVINTKLSH